MTMEVKPHEFIPKPCVRTVDRFGFESMVPVKGCNVCGRKKSARHHIEPKGFRKFIPAPQGLTPMAPTLDYVSPQSLFDERFKDTGGSFADDEPYR